MRMPRPPPPATALIMTAAPEPSEAKNAFACSSVVASAVPSITGTPQRLANAFAATLSPNKSSASGDGPTKIIFSSAQRRASNAFSLRKP